MSEMKMSTLKMSHCFSLPIKSIERTDSLDELHTDIVDNAGDDMFVYVDESIDADAVCVAINNHDSLVEEVERLRGERDELVKMLDLSLDAACQPYACGEDFCERVMQLLAKIKGEDNE